MQPSTVHRLLERHKQQHVAVIYQYSSPFHVRELWYHKWGLGVLAFIGAGFDKLGCHVKYMDVQTMIDMGGRAFAGVRYALTLICGNRNVLHWGIVPALADWQDVRPLPATGDVLIASERKDISNLFAAWAGMRCPLEVSGERLDAFHGKAVIRKPRDFGSSVGVEIISNFGTMSDDKLLAGHIYQEFIEGLDVAINVIFDPVKKQHVVMEGIVLLPKSEAYQPIFDAGIKDQVRHLEQDPVYDYVPFQVSDGLQRKIHKLIRGLGGSSLARLDFRYRKATYASGETLDEDALFFIEINAFPTISSTSLFVRSVKRYLSKHYPEMSANAFVASSFLTYADTTSS